MERKNIRFISIILTIALGIGALMVVPAVDAETKPVTQEQAVTVKRIFTPVEKAKLLTLRVLYKQIRNTAKLIRAKVKTAKAAGKDLTTFTAELKVARKAAIQKAAAYGLKLTEAERTTLATMQTSIRTLKQQLKTQKKAKAPKATLEEIKVQIRAAIKVRNTYLKTIHPAARIDYSSHLVTRIAAAKAKLVFLKGLLARLP